VRSAVPVVILKLAPYPLHSGAIGIARSLGRLGVDIHLLGESASSPLGQSRYVRSAVALPAGLALDETLADVIRLAAPSGHPLLIPVDDLGAVFVQRHASALQQSYRFAVLPHGLTEKLVDKYTLARLAHEAGVLAPRQAVADTADELDDFLASATFPVVVKARDPERFIRSAATRSVEIADTPEAVREAWRRHLVDGRSACLLQEYIPGGPETIWMINAYVDDRSALRFAGTGRKVRQYPPYTGATSLGRSECNEEVIDLTTRLVRHIGYRGILDIGWRFDSRDETLKLLDFNPRIGATFRLFIGTQGLDVLRAYYLDLTNQTVPSEAMARDRTWLNEIYDILAATTYVRDRRLTVADYVRSLSGVNEVTWVASDDLRPALSAAPAAVHLAVSYGVRKARQRRRPFLPTRQDEVVRAQPLQSAAPVRGAALQ
jgi:D-aspartate ligase